MVGLMFSIFGSMGFGNLIIAGGLTVITTTFFYSPATKYFQTKVLPKLENGYKNF